MSTQFCAHVGMTNRTNSFSFVTPAVVFKGNHKNPFNISFRCERTDDVIDQSMRQIYNKIHKINGEQLNRDDWPTKIVKEDNLYYRRLFQKALYECRCPMLDRFVPAIYREKFENAVISAIDSMGLKNGQTINIAMFGTGGLLTEWILLLRLIRHLDEKNFQGNIRIFLIDLKYKDIIKNAGDFTIGPKPHSFQWSKFVGGSETLNQFLTEICHVLPKTIKLLGSVFGDAKDYIARAQADASFKHDIVIGADIESLKNNSDAIVTKIKKEASRTNIPGIVLDRINYKVGNVDVTLPSICKVGPQPGTNDYFNCKPI